MTKKLWKIPTAKEYEAKLGIRNPQQRARIESSFRTMMRPLRALLKRNAEIYYRAHKNRGPCETCAFAPRTRRRGGFLATSHGLMKSLLRQKPFVCHANQSGHAKNEIDPKRLMVCMGFALVAHEPKAVQAAECAHQALEQELRNS
ncbi:MAG: hypothetical protein KW804_00960 [Candidatus Doudnabacteria bacterium]|nr:hypothetical protein [Candidatus Doudnabacteria bacterium]